MRVFWVVCLALSTLSCKPSPKLPLTGEHRLEWVGASAREVQFRFYNQTTRSYYFRASRRDGGGAYPWDSTLKCKADPSSNLWSEGPYALVDGTPLTVEVPSGVQLDLYLSADHELRLLQESKGGRCVWEVKQDDGSYIGSNEFEP